MMTGCDMATQKELRDYAVSRKIIRLMREGYPQKQATAIAFRMLKDGELNIPGKPKKKKKNPIKERNERRRRYQSKLRKRRGY